MMKSDFSTLFELLPIGAYRSTPDGRQLHANAALVRLNGYEDEAAMLAAVDDIGREWYVDAKQRAEFTRRLERDGYVVDFVSEIYRHKTRERIWIRENAHVVRDAQGRNLFFEGTVEDITAQRVTQLALETSERRFRALTEKAQVLTIVFDAEGTISYASPASVLLLGRAPVEIAGTNIFSWVHPDDAATARADFASVVAQSNTGQETTVRVSHADGGWRDLASVANNCLADSAVAGIVLHLRDVTERKRAEAALQRLAERDALTDLPNRRYLIERLTQALTSSLTRSHRFNALLFIDLDDFKSVNDSFGHKAGDLLLQAAAVRLRACVRAVDTVSRFGGDEFVVLLEAFAPDREAAAAQALGVGEKILEALNRPYNLDGQVQSRSCSLGATLFGDVDESVDEIVKRADRSLYEAKRAGRNALRIN